jgi:hypothetical protein
MLGPNALRIPQSEFGPGSRYLDIGLFPVGSIYCYLGRLERAASDTGSLRSAGSDNEQRCQTFCFRREHWNVAAGHYRLRSILDLALGANRAVARNAINCLPGRIGSLFSRILYLQCFACR